MVLRSIFKLQAFRNWLIFWTLNWNTKSFQWSKMGVGYVSRPGWPACSFSVQYILTRIRVSFIYSVVPDIKVILSCYIWAHSPARILMFYNYISSHLEIFVQHNIRKMFLVITPPKRDLSTREETSIPLRKRRGLPKVHSGCTTCKSVSLKRLHYFPLMANKHQSSTNQMRRRKARV